MATPNDTTTLCVRNTTKNLQKELRVICLELGMTYSEFLQKAVDLYGKNPRQFKQSR